jgi:integrase
LTVLESAVFMDAEMGLEHVSATLAKVGERARVKVDERTKRAKDGEPRQVVKWASAHDLRRSFGTRWAPRCTPAVLQRLMRHADIQTTMRYYVDLDADELAAGLWRQHRAATGNTENVSEKASPTATP